MKSKTILVISTHSFVDLITNSSSELFVCNSNKTIDAVKDLLQKLLTNHDEIEGESHLFESVFGTIELSKYGFEYYKVNEKVRVEYEYFHGKGNFSHFQTFSCGNDKNEECTALTEKGYAIRRKYKFNGDLYKKDKKEYDRLWALIRKEEDALWTDYGARQLESTYALFIEFLIQNEFTSAQLKKAKQICNKAVKDHIKNKKGQYGYMSVKMPNEIKDAYDTFSLWTDYGITAKKGAILIHSKDDNSIPYHLMETINSYLSAQRYHIG